MWYSLYILIMDTLVSAYHSMLKYNFIDITWVAIESFN